MLRVLRKPSNFKTSRIPGIVYNNMSFNIRNYSSDAIADRYKSKLLEKAKSKGFNSIEELQESMKKELEENRKAYDKIDPLKELEKYEQQVQFSKNILDANELRNKKKDENTSNPSSTIKKETPKVKHVKSNGNSAPYKVLDSYLDLEKIKDLSSQEIEYLWRSKWGQTDGAMNAVVPLGIYNKMLVNAKANPVFVLPLPRNNSEGKNSKESEGIELHYIQWQFPDSNTSHCIMTSLAEYKLRKEFSRPHTTLEFHSELGEAKNLVLMNGQIESNMNISAQDAQLLLLNVQRFFGAMGDKTITSQKRIKLLKDFTKGSPDFNVNLLVTLAQSMEN